MNINQSDHDDSKMTSNNVGLRRCVFLLFVTSIVAIVVAERTIKVILSASENDSLAFDATQLQQQEPQQLEKTEITDLTNASKSIDIIQPSGKATSSKTTDTITNARSPVSPDNKSMSSIQEEYWKEDYWKEEYWKLRPDIFNSGLNDEEQKRHHILRVTEPWSNVSTVGFRPRRFFSGFRNQIMAFSSIVMYAGARNHSQILLPTVMLKDTFGTSMSIPFELVFDVEHWNSLYPALPRLVHCDQSIFTEFDCNENGWKPGFKPLSIFEGNATKPYMFDKQESMFRHYKMYSANRSNYQNSQLFQFGYPNPMDLAMRRGGLRPHPDIQALIDSMLRNLSSLDEGSNSGILPQPTTAMSRTRVPSYVTLHARVEPDMIRHKFCSKYKVVDLAQIFKWMEERFPTAPAKHIFLPINRQYMEKEGYINTKDPNSTNWIAVHNLQALNNAVKYGLWNGTAKVFEFGANALSGTKYEKRPSTIGALFNFYIAINSKIFIGTPISSYSHDLLTSRFFRNLTENYKYVPEGMVHWTPPGVKHPPGFFC